MQQSQQQEEFNRFIEAVIKELPAGSSEQLKALAWQFYSKLPIVDLEALNPQKASAIVVEGYKFLETRTSSDTTINITPAKLNAVIEILNNDMPFLVDSITAELARQGITITNIIHPIISLKRDSAGKISNVAAKNELSVGYQTESFIRIETGHLPENLTVEKLTSDLLNMLANVRFAVQDWVLMQTKIDETILGLKQAPPAFKREEITEVCDFLQWLVDRNFVFLGYIEYDFYDKKGNKSLAVVPNSELGVFKGDDGELKPKGLEGLPPEVLHFALVPQLIEITKSMRKSTVHRPVHMDYIGLKRFDKKGNVIGERRFLGLFTSNVYYQSASDIPFIRRKIARIMSRANFDPASYDGKSLKAILEFTQRDELFQFSEEDLFDYAMGILSLETKPGVRLFIRRDIFERFISCSVFMPRENYSGHLREEIQTILTKEFNGKISAYYIQITESPLARLQVTVTTNPGHIPEVNIGKLEAEISRITHRWSDALFEALYNQIGGEAAYTMMRIYGSAFPKAYINDHDATATVFDIQKINSVLQSGMASLDLFHSKNDPENIVHLKWYNANVQIPLSDLLPILENMGFKVIDEQPYLVKPVGTDINTVWIRDFILSVNAKLATDISSIKPLFEESLAKVWQHESENDALGALVLTAGLSWREVGVLRAYTKYLRQVNFPYGLDAIAATLNHYPKIARALIDLFIAKFDPVNNRETESLIKNIDEQLANVVNLSDDRILRRLIDIIAATLRTNVFQTNADGSHKPYFSFKFDSAKIPELPLPHPYAEIFVYSARFEGIHLRGGRVARGGLRWSDRREDFRTEILGLMKAQMVKNSVIVPVGSKGGFVLKQAPTAREAFMEEGIACYKLFLSGLLDITDNIIAGKVVSPTNVVRLDGDDPYLVVAADKGTASFSDYANAVSAQYNFWLGDAFASGGSVGYDHKKMAITAKGAFISVARHFRELGIDIYNQDFTVVGIGDMAGDVFGNGMLLSQHIKLLGAFNHMHIFLDPTPDAKKTFEERKRLFNLPRSSWKDYNPKLISKGGGIFERSSKSIAISVEVQKALGIEKSTLSPDELIQAMLLAPVDLLWNGGIGTYVKAEDEGHEQVGDRTNNALRVNGNELRCKVVGEGGNLGFTQRGRIEYAENGGKLNTDAIDNSAGVDCSDHEVNIKIGIGTMVSSGQLPLPKRDTLLASMTDEVGDLVLKDNQLQTQIITITEFQASELLDEHIRMMHRFENNHELDRVVEYLPSDKQLAELKNEGKGLTRPEISVLLAYSKMSLYPQLLKSSLPDEEYFKEDLLKYFPSALQNNYAEELLKHPLKREIIATVVTNDLINHTGITAIHNISEDTGIGVAEVARAFAATREIFKLVSLWSEVEALDGKIAVNIQIELFKAITDFTEKTAVWFLRNAEHPVNVQRIIAEFGNGIEIYKANYSDIIYGAISDSYKERIESLTAQNIPGKLATDIALLEIMSPASDVIKVSNNSKSDLRSVGSLYFQIGALLHLDWLRQQAERIKAVSHWDGLAISSIINNLFDEQRRLTASVIASKGSIEKWSGENTNDIARFTAFVDELRTGKAMSLPKLVIAARKIKEVGR